MTAKTPMHFAPKAVALEFVLCLKDLMYSLLVPLRSKRELARTRILEPARLEEASSWVFFGASIWLLVAGTWVGLVDRRLHWPRRPPKYFATFGNL